MFQLRRLPPCLARSLLAQRAIWTKGQIGQEFGEVHISRTTIKVEKTTGESSSSMTYKGAQTIIPEEEFNEKQDRIVNYVSKDCLGCCKKVGFNQD
jgi:hypothetical protein